MVEIADISQQAVRSSTQSEFYLNIDFILLQSPKPKTGIFCFLIHEARPATELELPGGENVFVIKVCIVYSVHYVPCFSNVFSRRGAGCHRRAKPFELNFFKPKNLSSDDQTNQAKSS